RIGQIGLGYWGPNLLRAMREVPRAQVVALADSDGGRLPPQSAHGQELFVTRDYRELLGRPDVDAVIIAVPAALHARMVGEALEAGKHVLVEKPLAMTVADGAALVALAERNRRVLMVGHIFLYNAAVRRLKEYIASGELGDVLYLYAQRLNLGRVRQDVNALWNFGPHDVSILLYLLGAAPQNVSARGFAYLQPDLEDVVFLTATFPGGVCAHVHISWLDPHKVRRMTVVGSRKMVVYDDASVDARIVLHDRGVDRVPTADSPSDFGSFAEFQLALRHGDITIPALKFPEPLQLECQHFVDCVTEGRTPLTDGRHALEVVRVLEAAQRSLREDGRTIALEGER
ncbi:MAG: Gfo/Idh/MocA family protein, partial [Candidatus Binatia bacterium]